MFKVIVTGGLGFIGCHLVKKLLGLNYNVMCLDSLGHASNTQLLKIFKLHKNFYFTKIDITNKKKVNTAIHAFKPDKIINLAAESHVDRSIENPEKFIKTNILGTFYLLESSLSYFNKFQNKKKSFLFHHVSTDEVFGDLGNSYKKLFNEYSKYNPGNPYSATKASSDHFVRSWFKTYNLPTLISNCSNNFGPYQFPEKLIPKSIISLILNKKIDVYGDGSQMRDWIFVEDHVDALIKIVNGGLPGETYNVGSFSVIKNIQLIKKICKYYYLITNKKYKKNSYLNHVRFVKDRPGHDKKYAINANKIKNKLNWRSKHKFASSLFKTIEWYVYNKVWWKNIIKNNFKLTRIGLIK